jgi:hypothetical protein
MNKRFASFLLTGKVAALPLFAQDSFAAIQDISLKNTFDIKINKSLDRDSLAIRKSLVGEGHDIQMPSCVIPLTQAHTPEIMNLVITGLYDKDEVLVVVTHKKSMANVKKINPKSLAASDDIIILNHFSISDTSLPSEAVAINKKHDNLSYPKRLTRAISLPVDLKSFPQVTGTENMLYLHVFVAKNAQWNKPIIRYSDRLELKSIDKTMLFSQYTEDCTVYTCP